MQNIYIIYCKNRYNILNIFVLDEAENLYNKLAQLVDETITNYTQHIVDSRRSSRRLQSEILGSCTINQASCKRHVKQAIFVFSKLDITSSSIMTPS